MQLGDTTKLPLIGTIAAGRFLILDIIATGGMGTIYRAHQLSMGRQVALKLLGGNDLRDPEFVERFIREARATAQLRSPHTIVLHDFGRCDDSSLFIAMELLSGTSLDNILREAPMHPARVRRLMIQVCLSLEEAHQRGLVHRDIKPSNIMLEHEGTPEEFVKVLDFGLVKVTDNPDPNAMALTRPGTIHGTPPYMAPEMWAEGTEIGPAVDIYAFGATMFEMLTGRRAFMAKSIPALLHKHMSEAPPHLEDASLQPFDAVIQRCLSKKIEDRYPNVKSLRLDLLRLDGPGVPAMETDLIAGRGPQRTGDLLEPAVTPSSKEGTWRMDGPRAQEPVANATTPLVPPTLQVPPPDKTKPHGATVDERPMAVAVATEPGAQHDAIAPPAPKPKLLVAGAALALISAVAFAVVITRPDPTNEQPIIEITDPPVTSSVTVVKVKPAPPPPPLVKVDPPPPRIKPPPRMALSVVKSVAVPKADADALMKDLERELRGCKSVLDGKTVRIHLMLSPQGSLRSLRIPDNAALESCLAPKAESLRVPPFEATFGTIMAELKP